MAKYYKGPGVLEEMKNETLLGMTLFLRNINEILTEYQNERGGSFILGSHISWADFWLAHFTSYWIEILAEPDLLKEYEALNKQQTAVMSLPKIREWIEKRPKSII
jgi:glutathione S-transferase